MDLMMFDKSRCKVVKLSRDNIMLGVGRLESSLAEKDTWDLVDSKLTMNQ